MKARPWNLLRPYLTRCLTLTFVFSVCLQYSECRLRSFSVSELVIVNEIVTSLSVSHLTATSSCIHVLPFSDGSYDAAGIE